MDVPIKTAAGALREALDVLRAEAASAYHRLAAELDGLVISLSIDQEEFQLRCSGDHIEFAPPRAAPHVRVRTNRQTILALIDGTTAMLPSILSGQLVVYARVDLLPNIARASVAFAEGAIRSRAMRVVLDDFQREPRSAA
jgi:hypothetical protein